MHVESVLVGVGKIAALVLASIALTACSIDAVPEPVETDAAPIATEPEPCEVVFTPVPELLDETVNAAARWSAAVDCDIHVGEGGIAVLLVDRVPGSGPEHPGWGYTGTTGANGALEVQVTAERFAPYIADNATMMHEMGHALFPRDGHVDECPTVIKEGALLCSTGGAGLITAADLDYVCAGFPCGQNASPEA